MQTEVYYMQIDQVLPAPRQINCILKDAVHDQLTISEYDNLLRLKLRSGKDYDKKVICRALSELTSNNNIQAVFDDLQVYGFMVARSNGKYFLQ